MFNFASVHIAGYGGQPCHLNICPIHISLGIGATEASSTERTFDPSVDAIVRCLNDVMSLESTQKIDEWARANLCMQAPIEKCFEYFSKTYQIEPTNPSLIQSMSVALIIMHFYRILSPSIACQEKLSNGLRLPKLTLENVFNGIPGPMIYFLSNRSFCPEEHAHLLPACTDFDWSAYHVAYPCKVPSWIEKFEGKSAHFYSRYFWDGQDVCMATLLARFLYQPTLENQNDLIDSFVWGKTLVKWVYPKGDFSSAKIRCFLTRVTNCRILSKIESLLSLYKFVLKPPFCLPAVKDEIAKNVSYISQIELGTPHHATLPMKARKCPITTHLTQGGEITAIPVDTTIDRTPANGGSSSSRSPAVVHSPARTALENFEPLAIYHKQVRRGLFFNTFPYFAPTVSTPVTSGFTRLNGDPRDYRYISE